MSRKLFSLRNRLVSFCEQCASACTAACRQEALLARGKDQALSFGGRF